MNLIILAYTIIMIIAAMICMVIIVYVWPQRRKNAETLPLILLMAGITEWICAALLGMLDQNLLHKLLWAKIEYIGVLSVPLMVLVYVIHHCNTHQWMKGKRLAWLADIPLLTLLLAWTNEYHRLIWATYVPYLQDGLAFSNKTYGPAFWLYWVYSYLLLLAATVLTVRSIQASTSIFRWQNLLIAIGILAPRVANFLYILHIDPIRNLDLTPLAFGITGVALAIGMFRWQLFNITPVAQAAAFTGMADGLIILDKQDRLLDVNPAAQAILGQSGAELAGKPVEDMFAERLSPDERSRWKEEKSREIKLPVGSEDRDFALSDSPFYEKDGSPVGKIIFMHDVTEQKKLEERLREAEHKQLEGILHENEQRLASIYETVGDVIFYLSVEPDQQYRFVSANPAFYNITGLAPAQVVGRKVNEVIPEPSLQVVLEKYRQAIEKKAMVRWEEVSDYPTGRLIGEVSVAPVFDDDGLCTHLVGTVHDITERKQAEQKIQRLNRYLRAISNANQIIVRASDEAGLLTEVCQCIVETAGYSKAWVGFAEQDSEKTVRPVAGFGVDADYLEAKQISWADNERGRGPTGTAIRTGKTVIAQDLNLQPGYVPWRQQALQAGDASSIAIPLLHNEQCLGALNIYSQSPQVFDPDEVKLLEELGMDLAYGITALRTRAAWALAEKELRLSEDKFKYVFDHSAVGMSLTLPTGELRVNQAFCEMLGYSAQELQDRKWQDITHPEDIELTQSMVDSLLSGEKQSIRFIKRYLSKNGSTVWADASSSIRRDEAGQPVHMMTSVIDITERMWAGEALRETSERLAHMLANSTTVIYHLQVEGDQAVPNWISDNIQAILGFLPEDALQPDWWLAQVHLQDRPIVQASLEHLLDDFYQHEYRFVHKDGRLLWLHDEHRLLRDGQGTPCEVIGTWTDITERKWAEEALKEYNTRLESAVDARTLELKVAQEKLVRQEKLAVLGQLAGGVGHELRNPLSVINNAIYYLKLVQPDADEKIRHYHSMIEHEVQIAEKIITDLLDFARIKSVDRQPITVAALMQHVLERFPVPDSITSVLDLPADLPEVNVDPRQMEQVLGNLTTNACQAMNEGGTLTVRAWPSTLAAGQPAVCIKVIDTGTGITPENMKKLFEPLFTTKLRGIGLGLAVSQKLVEANSGRIEVDSQPGQGSTFTVYLPVVVK